jgi:hypothetical protein
VPHCGTVVLSGTYALSGRELKEQQPSSVCMGWAAHRVARQVGQLEADVDVVIVADRQLICGAAKQMHLAVWPARCQRCAQRLQRLTAAAQRLLTHSPHYLHVTSGSSNTQSEISSTCQVDVVRFDLHQQPARYTPTFTAPWVKMEGQGSQCAPLALALVRLGPKRVHQLHEFLVEMPHIGLGLCTRHIRLVPAARQQQHISRHAQHLEYKTMAL